VKEGVQTLGYPRSGNLLSVVVSNGAERGRASGIPSLISTKLSTIISWIGAGCADGLRWGPSVRFLWEKPEG